MKKALSVEGVMTVSLFSRTIFCECTFADNSSEWNFSYAGLYRGLV